MKKNGFLIVAISLWCGGSSVWSQHSHIHAGAWDSDQSGAISVGDQLKIYDLAAIPLLYNAGLGNYGDDGFLFNGNITFTALHQATYPGMAPSFNSVGAMSGSFLTMVLFSVLGPAGSSFAFYDTNSLAPSLFMVEGATGGAGSYALTEAAFFSGDPDNGLFSDPYGHIHGRQFAVTQSGTYTVGWYLHDTQGLMQDSPVFFVTYLAVPEPSSLTLAGWGLLVGVMGIYLRKYIISGD